MAKVLKIAALVVGAVALAFTGIGLAIGMPLSSVLSFGIGVSAGTLFAVSAGLYVASALLTPKPSQGGSQTKWKADPYAGLPYVMGRTLISGNIVYRRGHGDNNKYETFVTVLGIGPFQSIDATFMNRTTVGFVGGNAILTYHNQIYQVTQLGACPEFSALAPPIGSPPGWTSAHKLSGLAAAMNTFVYDSKSKNGLTAEPQPGWIVKGALVYDPRLDSTYPGGSGTCRAGVESTYVWSENPHLHGLTWALGRWQNGVRVAGIGAPIASIDVASFVEGANLNDARGWKIGGQVTTRPDTPWNSLKSMLQAGGAQPVLVGGVISCVNRAPRVSLATISREDIVGECSFAGTQPRRSRINTVIPNYRSEAHDWEVVAAAAVSVADYVAMDGDERTKEINYSLVQQVDQAAQLAAYDICDAREAGPGSMPLKPVWMNYRIGDCVTFEPEDGFVLKVVITGRNMDPQTGTVTFTVISETDGKHAFALGLTGSAPPTASLAYDDSVAAPGSGDWSLSGATLSSDGGSIPALTISGTVANPSADAVLFDHRAYVAGAGVDDNWIGDGMDTSHLVQKVVTAVAPGTQYEVSIRYRVRGVLGDRLILGPVVAGSLETIGQTSSRIRLGIVKCSTDLLVGADAGGGFGKITVADHSWDYPGTDVDVDRAGAVITGLTLGTRYYVYFDDETLGDPAPTYYATTSLANASNTSSAPYRHFLGFVDVPISGGGSTPGGGGGGGGGCPALDMYVVTQHAGAKSVADLAVDDMVWARHELTGIWGWYRVSAISTIDSQLYSAEINGSTYRTSADHLWDRNDAWRMMASLPNAEAIGAGQVRVITVEDAHTYMLLPSADATLGVLSHNKVMDPDLL